MVTKNRIKKVLIYLKPHKLIIYLSLIASFLISFTNVIESYFLSYLVDEVIFSNARKTLITLAFVMVVIIVFRVLLKGIKCFFIQNISFGLEKKLMKEFYDKVLSMEAFLLEKYKTGELISRINDVRVIREAFSDGLVSFIENLTMFFIFGFVLCKMNLRLFYIQLFSIINLCLIVLIFGRYFAKELPKAMGGYADLQTFTTECFNSVETIKSYTASELFKNKFKEKQRRTIEKYMIIGEKRILQNTLCTLIERICTIFTIIVGSFCVMEGTVSLGKIIGFISLSTFFTSSVNNLLALQVQFQEAFTALDRLFEIMDEKSEINDKKLKFSKEIKNISLENLSFSYTEKELINDLKLNISQGEWISFVGKTGSGKSTLLKIILKLYKAKAGKIFCNEIELNDLDTELVRKIIGYIPQTIDIFSLSIKDNITMLDSTISDQDVIDVLTQVGLYEKIKASNDGINSIIGERNFSLSGGERQKIAICRAIIKKPSILLMDEGTSNLDAESEKEIIKILKKQKIKGKTIITVAHRLSTVKNCDRIYFLEDGKIIESGTFEELKNKIGAFSLFLKDEM